MIIDDIFSWQHEDYNRLCEAYHHRILFLHSNDMTSPYHVLTAFNSYLNENGHLIFTVSKVDPNLITPLMPFLRAANENISKCGITKSLASNIVKDITHSDTLKQLIENAQESQKTSSLFLNQRENDLIARFEYAAKGYFPVFTFYGYSNFDSMSKNLISLLISGQLDNDFSFLNNAKYIFLCEYEDDIESYQKIKCYKHIDIALSNPNIEDMEEILSEISPSLELQNIKKEKLFHLSGGHLSVIEIIARYLTENIQATNDCTPEEIVDFALDDRLERMGNKGNEIKNVLETAAAIGDVFDIPLLKRATDQIYSCDNALKKSDQEYLTICGERSGKFRYREIWNYFFRVASETHIQKISCAIADAIYFFNPYDYLTRGYHLERAGKIRDACELYILSINTTLQEGSSPSKELIEKIAFLSDKCDLSVFWTMFQSYYSAIQRLDFEEGLEILGNMPAAATPRMLLLKEYLIGLCSHRVANSLEQQQNAIIAIEKAAEFAQNKEDGIWCDCQMILISFYMNFSGDISLAKSSGKRLTYFYTEKRLAPFALKGLHALERKHSALYSVEKAVIKTQSSVDFFRNSTYPAQYLMALNNHSANLIVLGRFSEALVYLTEASEFLSSNRCTSVNLMYLLNNYCLCSVLEGRMEAFDACEKLTAMLKGQSFGDWKIIIELNCAIYKAYSGDLDQAEIALLALEKLSKELSDDYYLYYTYANLSSVVENRHVDTSFLLECHTNIQFQFVFDIFGKDIEDIYYQYHVFVQMVLYKVNEQIISDCCQYQMFVPASETFRQVLHSKKLNDWLVGVL